MKNYIKENKSNIYIAIRQNYFYGLSGVFIPVAVFIGHPIVLAIALYCFYSTLSMLVNRDKYTTNLGKYVWFPAPAMCGGLTAFYLGELIKQLI